MATWANINSQDSSSPLMEQLAFFHDHAMMILVMITLIVSYVMTLLFNNKFTHRFLLEGQTIELIWTIAPAVTLVFIALPSLRLLYLLDEINFPLMTVKCIGHQWYWSYELSDFKSIEFDSYMAPTNEMKKSDFRLLDVDNRLPLPYKSQIRFLVSSTDVIHSWAVPSMGVKIDANPGRLNQASFFMNRPGIYFGQCSEICGTNHSFMPIAVESISPAAFVKWAKSF
uniref:Cytochrome c oxidase subunit 2 n=1 Tax=Pyrearinus termitilluminans TaxID=109589 RepID=A0A158V179_9COLE|nr:cytochrome c oxidase subunit II [Pyrearinus termitilluminans]AIQ80124.1 cytochrome c oxidase subunit II [Pyrearinus termitilluminans]